MKGASLKRDPGTGSPRPGRIVMLVDNGIDGDSRVQKAAFSAAEAGWDVTLLGVMGQAGPQDWRIGGADVRLLRVAPYVSHPNSYRRSLLRRPLAYPPGRMASIRIRSIRAWRADLTVRRAQIVLARRAGGPRWREVAGKARLLVPWIVAMVLARWAKFRAGELTRLQRNRQRQDSLLNKISISFWQRSMGARCWRRLDPGLWEYELAFGPVIDKLKPDLIHAHDFRMIGVAARATLRARAKGRYIKLLWDAHEFVPGITGRPDPRWLAAQIAYERESAPYADAVVTVSPALADLLVQAHGLRERPTVVLNAPPRYLNESQRAIPVPDLRALCGIGGATPLLVYCGGVNPSRGIDLMIDALPSLPGVHVALVTLRQNGATKATEALRSRASDLGVADRVHLLPYVPYQQVASFLSTADAAVSPLHHLPNHEIALSNKFFEYAHARLPMVISDVRTMAETTRLTGQGEVFRAQDLDDYLRAVRAVLAEPQQYRAAYGTSGLLEQWTWEAQYEVLDKAYRRLLPDHLSPEREVVKVARTSIPEERDLPSAAPA